MVQKWFLIVGVLLFAPVAFSQSPHSADTEAEVCFYCQEKNPAAEMLKTAQAIEAKAVRSCRLQKGKASYYGKNDGRAGKRTKSGEIFNPSKLTAAHKTLPFGTKVTVKNPRTGREVVVRINDKGPSSPHRIIDVSLQAARALGFEKEGIATVELQICN